MIDTMRTGEEVLNNERVWRGVLERDRALDGRVVYAVRSTGIYCRPSCPSRKPRPENVDFFVLPELAEQAGYRPCKRCRPDRAAAADPQIETVRRLCRYIDDHTGEALTLPRLAAQAGLSPSHLQRLFKAVVGVSPQAYADARRMARLRRDLAQGDDISGATFDAGYGSSSRLYSKADAELGMTPGRYKQGGRGVYIRYAIRPCFLGELLVAATERGLCAVRIGAAREELEAALKAEFAEARLEPDDAGLADWVAAVLQHLDGVRPHRELPLDIRATAFQKRVWQELQKIPYGETRSYQEVAEAIGRPAAVRAVAGACASNPVALVVPCHRVVRKGGDLGGYRWGVERKKALLEKERSGAWRRGEG